MMRFLTRYAFSLVLVLCGTGSLLIAQTPVTQKKVVGGVVTGKVTIKGKAAPGIVVGMRVNQSPTPYQGAYKGTTDQEGKYRISDVPAGSYEVAPVAPAFVVLDASNLRGESVVLADGESADGIDFSLVRGGVITGKVTDADGRPAVEQRVNLIPADAQTNPRVPVYSFSGVQTDDRGIYRMFGLAAGRYKVSAGQSDDFFINNLGRVSFKLSFYTDADDASDPGKATVVKVTEGGEAANIDITLARAAPTFAASGRIVDGENGQPVAGARLGMLHIVSSDHGNVSSGANSISNSKGEFKIENLPPGKYEIFLAGQPDSDLHSDTVAFDIVDQDVNELLVKSTKGAASVAGNIVLENVDDKALFAKLMKLSIQAVVLQSGIINGGSNRLHTATINADGSFRLSGLGPGALYLMLGAQDRNLVKGFTISRVERDGVVESRNIEIKNGDQITGVRLVVSFGNAIVRGVVKFDDGPLPADARVYIRMTKDSDTRRAMQSPQVDSRGHFIIEGIPGGLYFLETNMFVPGVVSRPRPPVKQQVTVLDGAVTEVTITLENPKPDATPH